MKQKNGRGREIRTPDILLPKQARYQTALYPDISIQNTFLQEVCPSKDGANNTTAFYARQLHLVLKLIFMAFFSILLFIQPRA